MPRTDRVLVFGDVIDDIIVVPRAPVRRDTDTPSDIRSRPGGSAANTAAWLARAGADVSFVGRCAREDVARHAAALEAAGVRPLLRGDATLPTGTIIVVVEGDARSMLTERGANAALSPADVAPGGYDLVHATGYSLLGHDEAFGEFVDRAHAEGVRVSLNAGAVAAIDDIGLEAFLAAAAGVDILVATAAEASLLTGERGPDAAAVTLARRHGLVAVTTGREGAWVASGDTVERVPAIEVAAIDPTGAGDAFTAGFLAATLDGGDPTEAGRRGVALAAEAVSSLGGRPARA